MLQEANLLRENQTRTGDVSKVTSTGTPIVVQQRTFRVLGGLALLVALGTAGARAPASGHHPDVPLAGASADTAVFAGGCFWGVEAVFEHLKGVTSAVSGYAGGATVAPSYEQVSSGNTGHAESVQVIYDPAKISYEQLLQVFFTVAHDPTQLNRQGPDWGTQYRSIAFYRNAEQQKAIESYIGELSHSGKYSKPIATQVVAFKAFYPAEGYHQGFMAKHPTNPYIVVNDAPKLDHLQREFPALYRD
jgi:peptide-methionine (S)-S-oxide reductase